MLLNILQATGEPPRQNPPAPEVNRNPGLERFTHLQPIFTMTVSALVYPFGQGFPNLAARWNTWESLKSTLARDFPGGPVAKTSSFQCRGPRFDPW